MWTEEKQTNNEKQFQFVDAGFKAYKVDLSRLASQFAQSL